MYMCAAIYQRCGLIDIYMEVSLQECISFCFYNINGDLIEELYLKSLVTNFQFQFLFDISF